MLEHDWYYRPRPELAPDERAQLNFDHPDSLDTSLLVDHVRALRDGVAVNAPVYDFKTHSRLAQTQHIDPKPVIVVEGILVFTEEKLRELMNVKIFVDTDADIRLMRRIRRD